MKNLFNSIQLKKPKTNFFDLTHDVKLTMDMGELIPICMEEAVPGDKFNISAESLIRFAPLVAPVMHRFDVSIHYFFVPNRILWPNWEKFITNAENGGVTAPYFSYSDGNYDAYPLIDYMGMPRPPVGVLKVSALPFAAYQKIYNEYYRDQNLITAVESTLVDGDNAVNAAVLFALRKRAWEHDYFTSCLPFAQKGASVDIPLGDVTLKEDWNSDSQYPTIVDAFGDPVDGYLRGDSGGSMKTEDPIGTPEAGPVALDPNGSLEVAATPVNDLRRAFKLQEWLEKNARAGTRYVESILAHFGVRSSDARLQRPEYITGVKSPIVVSEVLNTTGETDGLPQGNMAGHGIGVATGRYGSFFCEEHGWIVGIMSVMPKTAYQQGLPRKFSKFDQFDHFWPEFAHIGEQQVLNKEVYVGPGATSDTWDDPFGYIPRYAEYKNLPSRVAGDFKTSLDFWHDGRIFATPPALNQEFIECVPDKRIFAVEDPAVDSIYVHVLNKMTAQRRMPKFGTPSF